eukprot:CAMPEP_0172010520 /NCGR_PEP_ID=MMETSP1041-20130122/7787_1 /TAXON_ID=464988 /ORGANISM="Hemiselmis andersenii, Strain CCMP439" /LENGTH=343 /DNA_ID=CAMNT_0012664913 /DNA_START=216 /DNA_END=1248 /DNA_ORIENTATION=+
MKGRGGAGGNSSVIMCDILPDTPAVLHDIHSGCNLCEACAETLRKHASSKGYFSKGIYPKPKPPSRTHTTVLAGVGIMLEMGGQEGSHFITRVISEGSAAQEGTLTAGDVLRFVDGHSVTGLSPQAVADLLGGPENTVVEVTVERDDKRLRPVRIRRGAASYVSERFDSYSKVPFYISESDRALAQEEASARVARLKSQIATVPFPPLASITSRRNRDPSEAPAGIQEAPLPSSTPPAPPQQQQQQPSPHDTAQHIAQMQRQEELRLLHQKQQQQKMQQQQQQLRDQKVSTILQQSTTWPPTSPTTPPSLQATPEPHSPSSSHQPYLNPTTRKPKAPSQNPKP